MRDGFGRSIHFRSADRQAFEPPSLRPLKHGFTSDFIIPELFTTRAPNKVLRLLGKRL
ncbi:protein of unknown function [Methylocaldum szegediense]|uniref:Uncharacterized protein n=1 Tax=Methylocaldum szegediense TaxID=73780 RepID=A0ABM9HXF4_9GAMM|nr:protein of unknown function [Methylocaldum szegediense]